MVAQEKSDGGAPRNVTACLYENLAASPRSAVPRTLDSTPALDTTTEMLRRRDQEELERRVFDAVEEVQSCSDRGQKEIEAASSALEKEQRLAQELQELERTQAQGTPEPEPTTKSTKAVPSRSRRQYLVRRNTRERLVLAEHELADMKKRQEETIKEATMRASAELERARAEAGEMFSRRERDSAPKTMPDKQDSTEGETEELRETVRELKRQLATLQASVAFVCNVFRVYICDCVHPGGHCLVLPTGNQRR